MNKIKNIRKTEPPMSLREPLKPMAKPTVPVTSEPPMEPPNL